MKTNEPHEVGKLVLVEECQRIEINSFLKSARAKLMETLLTSEIEAAGAPLSFATSQSTYGIRYWLKCPSCAKRVGVLYVHPITSAIGCRTCLGLEYRKRRFKGMAEVR